MTLTPTASNRCERSPKLTESRSSVPWKKHARCVWCPRNSWLKANGAGVGSPLELKFLRLFEEHGFHHEKQVPASPTDGGAPISVADFAVS